MTIQNHPALPHGANALLFGFKLLKQTGLKRYAIMPVLVNILVFGLGSYGIINYADFWITQLESWLPEWLGFLRYIAWLLLIFSIGFICIYLFTTVTQIIASPFNAILSERVEAHLKLEEASEVNPLSFWQATSQATPREIHKFAKSLKWLLLMLVVSFIPGINFLVFFISAWLLSIDYLDYPADNRAMSFTESLKLIKQKRFGHLVFGLTVALISLVPVLNLFVVPASVIGGTALWHNIDRKV